MIYIKYNRYNNVIIITIITNESYNTGTYCERMVVDMTFTKINENTVQCVIAIQELDQMGYALNELYTNREAASNFMRNVMEQGVEAGFQLNSQLQEIQVTIFSDEQLILNFTQVNPDNQIDQIIENALEAYEGVKSIGKERLKDILDMEGKEKIQAFQEIIEKYHSIAEEFKQPERAVQMKEVEQELEKKEPDKKVTKKENKIVREKNQYMFQFSDLSHLKQLCQAVDLKVSSHLYKDKTKYYLFVDFAGMEQEKVNSFMVQVLDFEAKIEKNNLVLAYVEEHANRMIEAKALEVLKKL